MPGWLHRIVTSEGVRQWGMPVAVTTAILSAGREQGLQWATFWSFGFALRLLVSVLVTGVLGGLVFEWAMKRLSRWWLGGRR